MIDRDEETGYNEGVPISERHNGGPLAQWQSNRLITDRFQVRILGGPPAFT